MLLTARGRPSEAVSHFQAAIENNPNIPQLHFHLAMALAAQGNWVAAADEFRLAAAQGPFSPYPHAGLAWALHNQGQGAAADEVYHRVLQLDPTWPQMAVQQAWSMATHPNVRERNGIWARALAEQASYMTQKKSPRVLDVLATSYAECGQFQEAIVTAREALALANKLKESDLAKEIEVRLECYQRNTAFRTTPSLER
jgi:Flp pilus assembly protein TadD